ncbi:unnamed protein product [Durusdinium trenchii]|uniref:Major facilitator superfamily (MFS) profile domain-containing protein n=1 Tax=Durusdinium trenchii TaxID=1381693 RepID=A0ABP0MSH5_9DINO
MANFLSQKSRTGSQQGATFDSIKGSARGSERVLARFASSSLVQPDADDLHSGLKFSHSKLAGSGGLLKAIRLMPRILLFSFWQQFYAYFSGDPFNAYVNSNISCPRPKPPCPVGSHWVGPESLSNITAHLPASFHIKDAAIGPEGICMPMDRFSPAWSLSAKCMNKDVVLGQTTRINGLNGWIAAFFGLFAVFVAGQIIDTTGRRPVLIAFLSSNIVVKLLLFISCFVPYEIFVAILFLQNVIEVAFAAGVEPALNAMIADRSRGNEDIRGDGFAALGVIMHLSDVLAFLAGYPVLRLHLTHYAIFWGPLTVVSIIAYVIFNFLPCSALRETLTSSDSQIPEEPETDEEDLEESKVKRCFLMICSETIAGFKMVWKDPFLMQFLVIWAMTTMAMTGSWNLSGQYLLGLGYEQANASLARRAWHLALVLGAAVSPCFIRHFNATGAYGIALLMMATGFFVCGTGGHDLQHASLFFWAGTVLLGGCGVGILTPSFNAIISIRVSDKEQGKLFSLVIVMNTICGLAFGQLWPQLFYKADADDWMKGLPWLASAAVFIFLLFWMLLILCFCKNDPQKAESDCGEDSSTDEDSME